MAETDFAALARVSTGAVAARHDPVGQSGLVAVEQARAVQEVQAKLIIAKKFPRNETQAIVDISQSCKRPSLAKVALYTYERGGTKIQGPSIRLAEVIARAWGNMDFGIRELSQADGSSDVEAYAWDLQTNTTASRSFKVQHKRYTKKGSYDLDDPRDIYETVANNGARRMRACILEIIPGDVVEDAVVQIRETLKLAGKAEGPIEDRIKKMAMAFNALGVSVEAIEGRLQHKIDLVTEDELVDLLAIYNSVKDGMSKRTDFFSLEGSPSPAGTPPPQQKSAGQKQPAAQKQNPPEAKAEQPSSPNSDVEESSLKTGEEATATGTQLQPTPEDIAASLKADPFSCPKDGLPLSQVDCEHCSMISTCQAMSGEQNEDPASADPPPPPPDPEKPKKRTQSAKKTATNDTWTCDYAKMEALYGKNVYGRYCQESCKFRSECPTLKVRGGPTK